MHGHLADPRLVLRGKALEQAVAEVIENIGGHATFPRGRLHDIEVAFPEGFRVRWGRDNDWHRLLTYDAAFVIEVKSARATGARIRHCRQLVDWTARVARRRVTERERTSQRYMVESAIERAHSIARDRAREDVDLDRAFRDLERQVAAYYRLTEPRIRGVLVVNHYLGRATRPRAFRAPVRIFAADNGIAMVAWSDLLEIESKILGGTLEQLDFWCALFDTAGPLHADFSFRWRSVVNWGTPAIFGADPEVLLPNGPGIPRLLR